MNWIEFKSVFDLPTDIYFCACWLNNDYWTWDKIKLTRDFQFKDQYGNDIDVPPTHYFLISKPL